MSVMFKATTKAAEAPDVENGVYDAKFSGITTKFISGGDYGDGERFVWSFTLLDDNGAVIYHKGDPLEIEQLTSLSTNTKSRTVPRAVRNLKALLTAEEYALFEMGEGVDAAALLDRPCQIEIGTSDSGWPKIVNVLPPRRKRRAGVGVAASSSSSSSTTAE